MNTKSLESRDTLDVDFSRYMRTLKSRWLLIALLWGGTIGLAGIAASLKLPSYEANTKILVRTDTTSTLTGVGRGVGGLDPLVKAQNPLTTEVEIISSKPVIERVIQRLELQGSDGQPLATEDFQAQLTVKIVGGADVINLSYQDTDPSVAAAVVNELAKLYIEKNAKDQQQRTMKALGSLEGQLPETQTFVRQAEEKLRRFREDNQIISLADESRSLVQLLETLDNQISEAQAAFVQVQTEADALQDSLGLTAQDAMAVSDISQSTAIQALLEELKAVERQKAVQRGVYTDQSPVVLTAQAQEDNLRQLLRQEIETVVGTRSPLSSTDMMQVGELRQGIIGKFLDAEVQRLSLANRVKSLEEFRSIYRERASNLPVLEQEQAQLEQTLEVARSTYQNLLQRLKELEAAEKQDIGNATVIEPAEVPEEAVSGERSKILALGGLLGAFLATTVVTLLTLRDEEKLRQESTLHLATPGTIPNDLTVPTVPSPFATENPEVPRTMQRLDTEESSTSQATSKP